MKKCLLIISFLLLAFQLTAQNLYWDYPDNGDPFYSLTSGRAEIGFRFIEPSQFYHSLGNYGIRVKYPGQDWGTWNDSYGRSGTLFFTQAGTYQLQGRVWVNYDLGGQTNYYLYSISIAIYVYDNNAPSAPANLTSSSYNDHPKVQWSSNDEYDLHGYKIYKKAGATLNWSYLASTSVSYYVDNSEDLSGVGSHLVWYKVNAYDINSNTSAYSSDLEIEVAGYALDKKGTNNNAELDFQLYNNYPNPFNPTTQISFSIPKTSQVSLRVYNSIGEVVAEVINENLEAGYHSVNFNAEKLPSGFYIYKIVAGNFSDSKKMLLIK